MRFLIALLALSALLAGLALLARANQWIAWPSFFYEILAFAGITTIVLFAFLYRVKIPAIFIQLYLLSMVVKILGSGIFIFIIAMKDRAGASPNVVFFLCAYILFTALEVAFLYYEKARNQSV